MRRPRLVAVAASLGLATPLVAAGVGSQAAAEPSGTTTTTPPDPRVAQLEQALQVERHRSRRRLRSWRAQNRHVIRLKLRIKGLRARSRSHWTGAPAAGLPVPHFSDWLCIHRYEGRWTDSGDPYWGGLQMDRSFMSTYAPRWLLAKGWADRWSPREQMWVAERAWRVRGFNPWPNTAARCGLL